MNSGLMVPILACSGVMANVIYLPNITIPFLLILYQLEQERRFLRMCTYSAFLDLDPSNLNIRSRVLEHIYEKHAMNDETGIVYTYLRYDSTETQALSNLLGAFIKQLCFRKELDPSLLDFFKEYSRDARVPSYEKLESHFIQLAERFTRFFILVDALDEAPQEQRKKIFKMILNLVDRLQCVQVFVTSRREDDIINMFLQLKAPKIEIEAKNNAVDIEIYVRGKVETLISQGELKLQDRSLHDKIVQELVGKADGM